MMSLADIEAAIEACGCGAFPDSLAGKLIVNLLYDIANSLENPGDVAGDLLAAGSLDGTALTNAFQDIFNVAGENVRILYILNDTDVPIWIADASGDESLYIPAKASLTLDLSSNGRLIDENIQVKYADVVGTEGQVIVSGVK